MRVGLVGAGHWARGHARADPGRRAGDHAGRGLGPAGGRGARLADAAGHDRGPGLRRAARPVRGGGLRGAARHPGRPGRPGRPRREALLLEKPRRAHRRRRRAGGQGRTRPWRGHPARADQALPPGDPRVPGRGGRVPGYRRAGPLPARRLPRWAVRRRLAARARRPARPWPAPARPGRGRARPDRGDRPARRTNRLVGTDLHPPDRRDQPAIPLRLRRRPVRLPRGIELYGRTGVLEIDFATIDHAECWPVLRAEFAHAVRTGTPHPLDVDHGLRLQHLLASASC